MNDILKQRLVGALVLIALGVLFWPVIFVETERPNIDRTPVVTPMPELAEVDIPPPKPLEEVDPVDMVEAMRSPSTAPEAVQPDAATSAAAEAAAGDSGTPESPALDEQGIPVAWVIQVASVGTREKADQLTTDLIAMGYKAYHRVGRKDGKSYHRVFVGPVFEREKLGAAKREIDERFNVSAIIARYVP